MGYSEATPQASMPVGDNFQKSYDYVSLLERYHRVNHLQDPIYLPAQPCIGPNGKISWRVQCQLENEQVFPDFDSPAFPSEHEAKQFAAHSIYLWLKQQYQAENFLKQHTDKYVQKKVDCVPNKASAHVQADPYGSSQTSGEAERRANLETRPEINPPLPPVNYIGMLHDYHHTNRGLPGFRWLPETAITIGSGSSFWRAKVQLHEAGRIVFPDYYHQNPHSNTPVFSRKQDAKQFAARSALMWLGKVSPPSDEGSNMRQNEAIASTPSTILIAAPIPSMTQEGSDAHNRKDPETAKTQSGLGDTGVIMPRHQIDALLAAVRELCSDLSLSNIRLRTDWHPGGHGNGAVRGSPKIGYMDAHLFREGLGVVDEYQPSVSALQVAVFKPVLARLLEIRDERRAALDRAVGN